MAGATTVEVLQVTLAARCQPKEAAHEPYLTWVGGHHVHARPAVAARAHDVRPTHPGGGEPGVREHLGLGGREQARLLARMQRLERGGRPQRRHGAGVGELEHLG